MLLSGLRIIDGGLWILSKLLCLLFGFYVVFGVSECNADIG